MLACQWKELLHFDCIGCGMQRSFIHVLKGEFVDAFYMYPAIYTLMLLFGFLVLHLKFNFKFGSQLLVTLFIVNIAIMVINYTLKFI